MTLREALIAIGGPAGPAREAAGRAVLDEVCALAERPLRRARTRTVIIIPPAERDEMVGRVVVKVISSSPLPVAETGAPDEVCRAYLAVMLANAWLSELRQRGRTVIDERVGEGVDPEGPAPGGSPRPPTSLIDLARVLLESIVERTCARVSPEVGSRLRAAWSELSALCFGQATMADVLAARGAAATAGPHERKQAADRVAKAHQRLRERVWGTIARMEREGELHRDRAALLRELWTLLLRRRGAR